MEHDKKKSLTKIAINTLVGSFAVSACVISGSNFFTFDKVDHVISNDKDHLKFKNSASGSVLIASKGEFTTSHVDFKSGRICNDFKRLVNVVLLPITAYSHSCRNLTEGDIVDLQERFPNEMKGITARFIPTQTVTLP